MRSDELVYRLFDTRVLILVSLVSQHVLKRWMTGFSRTRCIIYRMSRRFRSAKEVRDIYAVPACGIVLWNLSKPEHTKPTKLKRRLKVAETPCDRDAYTGVDDLCRVSVRTPVHHDPFSAVEVDPRATFRYRSMKPSAPRYLGMEEYFMNFLQYPPAGFYRCPHPTHQLCAGEFAWLITVRRVPASVDRLNERWRMRP